MAEKKKIEIFQNTLLKLLVRRGVDSDRKRIVLAEGELGYTSDTKRLYIGDGESLGGTITGNKWRGSVADHLSIVDSEVGDLVYNASEKVLYFWDTSNTWTPIEQRTVDVGGGGSAGIDDLTDVTVLNPVDGNILTYQAASQKWLVASTIPWDNTYNTVRSLSGAWQAGIDYDHTPSESNYTTVNSTSGIWNIKNIGLRANTAAAESAMTFDGFYTWQDASNGNERKLSQKYISNFFHVARDTDSVNANVLSLVTATSSDWNSVYSWTNSQSSSWVGGGGGGTYDDSLLQSTSGDWNIAYSTVSNKELNWDTAYNTVNSKESNWDTAYNTVNSKESNWDSAYNTVNSKQLNWDTAYNAVNVKQSNWDTAYTTVINKEPVWDSSYDTVNSLSGAWGGGDTVVAVVNSQSGYWDSSYTTINTNSGDWDATYTTVSNKESNWDSAYNTINSKEPDWDSTYNQVKTLSSSWSGADASSVYSQVNLLSGDWDTTYNTVNNKEPVWDNTYNQVKTLSSSWSGEDGTSVYSQVNLLSGDWDTTYNTVNSKESNWDTAYNTIIARQSNWDSVYNTVEGNKANWNSAYNTVNSKESNWDSAYNTVTNNAADWDKDALQIAASDETTNLTTGVVTAYRAPYAFTLSDVRASLTNAPVGTSLKVDVLASNVSIFSTIITIDAGSNTSVGSSSPRVISNTNINDDEELRVVITQVGNTIPGSGLKITFIGSKS